ncbi:hypothetical protein PR202_gb12827 [Eleusine coracana subsp. coracana]|uniref:Uncharacterized protein n=1 Tax=Eleusine coracana subsp. coracana TaxID=191504 RepID=A0AAV5ERJ8_ELECO|nr:hypothetical protein PR202_gb12827 [Eleusine coracana subsp. coracana]
MEAQRLGSTRRRREVGVRWRRGCSGKVGTQLLRLGGGARSWRGGGAAALARWRHEIMARWGRGCSGEVGAKRLRSG